MPFFKNICNFTNAMCKNIYKCARTFATLQMQFPLFNLLRPALIPELRSDVSAGPTGYRHLGLITVATVRALPYEFAVFIFYNTDFAVVIAFHTVITFGVQFRIHDIIIYELYDIQYCWNVILHVWHLNITDCTAR